MAKQLTLEQFLKLLKQRQGDRSQRDFSLELGVSSQHLCDVYHGRKEPGPTLLRAIGAERQVRVRYVVNS